MVKRKRVLVFISTRVVNILAFGRVICDMGLGSQIRNRVVRIMDFIKRVKSKNLEFSNRQY